MILFNEHQTGAAEPLFWSWLKKFVNENMFFLTTSHYLCLLEQAISQKCNFTPSYDMDIYCCICMHIYNIACTKYDINHISDIADILFNTWYLNNCIRQRLLFHLKVWYSINYIRRTQFSSLFSTVIILIHFAYVTKNIDNNFMLD